MERFFNIKARKVGGIWFLKLGRINLSFCISRELKGFGQQQVQRWPDRIVWADELGFAPDASGMLAFNQALQADIQKGRSVYVWDEIGADQ